MAWITTHLTLSLSYGFLYLSVLLLWPFVKTRMPIWSFTLFVSIILGLISYQLDLIAVVPIILLALAVYYSQKQNTHIIVRIIAGMFVLVISVGLGMHQFPGFHNLKVLDQVHIGHNAIPFTLYLNFDKAVVGILILGLSHRLISKSSEWLSLFRQIIPKVVVIIAVIIFLAFALRFVRFDPKLPNNFLIWAITNLLFVCVAEEAFFRGFIQKNLSLILGKINSGDYIAIFLAAGLFGAAHYPGGLKYMLLATVAGIGYGWIYSCTKRIEASIVAHIGLNLVHFLLFTYPALAN